MNNFDLLYNKFMESMVAGGSGSVFGSPTNGVEISSTGGAVGVSDDRAYAQNDTRNPHSTFGVIQKRPDVNRKKKKKS